jgi:chemotaxis regulatin CheY-phosphate phosphatase CheZ
MENIERKVLEETEGLSEKQIDQVKDAIGNALVESMNLYYVDQITDQKFMLTMMSLNELFDAASSQNANLKPGQLSGTNQDEVDDLLGSLGL